MLARVAAYDDASGSRMNPERLFDYLEGNLPEFDRLQLEEQLAADPQLQRELALARAGKALESTREAWAEALA